MSMIKQPLCSETRFVRNFVTLAKILNTLAIFGGLILLWAKL